MSLERALMTTNDSGTQACCDVHPRISHQCHLEILLSIIIADGI